LTPFSTGLPGAKRTQLWDWSFTAAALSAECAARKELEQIQQMSWTEERIERLKKMWHDGATASQIADELGGVSRNAVIGKAHRLGLEQRPSPVKPGDEKDAKKAAPAAAAPKAAAPKAEAPRPADAAPAAAPAPQHRQPATGPRVSAHDLQYRSIGPGGFVRQGPGDQQAPIPPAPPRRLVPAKPSPEVADKTSLLDLNDRICKWPIGHPGEPDFYFCGEPANPGFPYCVEHCGVAYQAQLPRRDRRPPPPLPFGGPRVR
jgi:GcrA cell cycle regulator